MFVIGDCPKEISFVILALLDPDPDPADQSECGSMRNRIHITAYCIHWIFRREQSTSITSNYMHSGEGQTANKVTHQGKYYELSVTNIHKLISKKRVVGSGRYGYLNAKANKFKKSLVRTLLHLKRVRNCRDESINLLPLRALTFQQFEVFNIIFYQEVNYNQTQQINSSFRRIFLSEKRSRSPKVYTFN